MVYQLTLINAQSRFVSLLTSTNLSKLFILFCYVARYFLFLCNVLKALTCDIKNSIIDIQLCLNGKLRQILKALR